MLELILTTLGTEQKILQEQGGMKGSPKTGEEWMGMCPEKCYTPRNTAPELRPMRLHDPSSI